MSDTRLELVEPCEHGNVACSEWFNDEDRPIRTACPGGSRRVLSVPTDQMVEAAALTLHFAGEGEMSSRFYRNLAGDALTVAFNTLGIQENHK